MTKAKVQLNARTLVESLVGETYYPGDDPYDLSDKGGGEGDGGPHYGAEKEKEEVAIANEILDCLGEFGQGDDEDAIARIRTAAERLIKIHQEEDEGDEEVIGMPFGGAPDDAMTHGDLRREQDFQRGE